MTEFHQFKKPEDRRIEPPTNGAQDPVIDAIARNAMSDPQNSSAETNAPAPSQLEKPPYEVIQQGPITYFRYYFEDADQTAYVPSDAPELIAKKSRLPLYLAGGGVLGATLISGVVIAGLDHPSKPPTPKTTPSSEVKPSPQAPIVQPRVAPPEVMPQSRSTQTKPAQKSKKTSTQESSTGRKVSSNPFLQEALVVPEALPVIELPPVPAAMPPSSLRLPAPTPPSPQTQVAVRPLPEVAAAPIPDVPLTLQPVSAPSFQNPPALASAPPLETAKGTQNAADAQCLSPGTEVGNASPANNSPVIETASSETVARSSALPKANVEKGLILKAAQSIAAQITSGAEAAQSIAAQVTSSASENKELQEFLELPQRFPSSAGIAVLPLPCQMAQMAIAQQKVGEFSVLRLKPQDYQKRWQTSSKNPQALLPIYGFVDYGQQSIVLVRSS